jgi:hypothetical protein
MGDVAEMMLNGFLCEGCGVFLDGEEPGFPRYCSPRCAKDRGAPWRADAPKRQRTKTGPYRRRAGHG